ncbi:MAG: pyridoxine 5'-phosphate synthase [Panacagrimonas sp.]
MRQLRLGVNIDHVATLRQARGTDYPDPVEAALMAQAAGADGITAHLREDRRHIQDEDIHRLLARIDVPLNLEMAVTPEMVALAVDVRPPHVCLVPERREELTTEGGLDVAGNLERVGQACSKLSQVGIRVSLFIDPAMSQLDAALKVGAPCCEIHTGRYCDLSGADQAKELGAIRCFAQDAHQAGLEVHAGHGLTTANVGPIAAVSQLSELNIGHALVARSVFLGMDGAVREMRAAMDAGRTQA